MSTILLSGSTEDASGGGRIVGRRKCEVRKGYASERDRTIDDVTMGEKRTRTKYILSY
jgi:hypothetical protein